METTSKFFQNWGKRFFKATLIVLLIVPFYLGLSGINSRAYAAPRKSQLAKGNAITDPAAILRYSLPIDNDAVRQLQGDIEDISNQLRSKRWNSVKQDVSSAIKIANRKKERLLAGIPDERQAEAEKLVAAIDTELTQLQEAVEARDKDRVTTQRRELLDRVTTLEELMVTAFPFEVPEEYSNLPQLKGRATVEMKTSKGAIAIIADGYSAPINAGNFVDLVQRGFYDGLEFIPGQDFVRQVGDPPGKEEGFIDPKTKEYRAIPLEVLIQGEEEPLYEITLEDAGYYLEPLALPFSAYGAVALARPGDDPNGGSSQVFFFLFDTELTPPGFNLLDGRYSVFGYVVEGKEVLDKLKAGDKVISAKVVRGSENLVQPS
ncbi:peptidylprolyl isomerase [Lusitaniella coriacea]|uniref:peptidylprolyl isomerase n=1 Tax=Lusitaniella coriacea TaxID=1983105 RepID=UPI003CECEADB